MADTLLERTAVTLEDLMKSKSNGVEVINGVLVERPGFGGLHQIIKGNIYSCLNAVADESEALVMGSLLYLMNDNSHHLCNSFAPDLSFIRLKHIPANWNLPLPFPGVPDFAVEVISPGDNAENVQTKVRTYLDKGTEQVWVVYPATREVYQFRRGQPTARIYRDGEQIDCESLFPGLVLTLATIFKLPPWLEKLGQG